MSDLEPWHGLVRTVLQRREEEIVLLLRPAPLVVSPRSRSTGAGDPHTTRRPKSEPSPHHSRAGCGNVRKAALNEPPPVRQSFDASVSVVRAERHREDGVAVST
jgi:hypothetical protein